MVQIYPMSTEYEGYCRDESRSVGFADSISFPESEEEIREILRRMNREGIPVTVQGGRTGLAAAAVPYGGHAMNLSKMNRMLGMRKEGDRYYLRVQPGCVLVLLRKAIEDRNMNTAGWCEDDLAVYREFCNDREYFFPTDPTETSATIGGMVSCNASGARSYRYGSMRKHVSAIRVVLTDGSLLSIARGENKADERRLSLVAEEFFSSEPWDTMTGTSHRQLSINLPSYRMPDTKNASGYYVEDDMDAIDLFIGSDSTLGVITEIELELLPLPKIIWGISCFFESEAQALDFTIACRERLDHADALEFFDADAIELLRRQKQKSTAFAALPDVEEWVNCCIYVELTADEEPVVYGQMLEVGAIMSEVGASPDHTWVARTGIDRDKQQFFRHAVPECTNMLIDERKKKDPVITKLAADMSVPNQYLKEVVALYRRTLQENELQTTIWGHIGNNHLHVNILPRDGEDYRKGRLLNKEWAKIISGMGGAVSAEHGVGKLKRDYLTIMYGEDQIREMARMKKQFDPKGILGRGNLFSEEYLKDEDSRENSMIACGSALVGDVPKGKKEKEEQA